MYGGQEGSLGDTWRVEVRLIWLANFASRTSVGKPLGIWGHLWCPVAWKRKDLPFAGSGRWLCLQRQMRLQVEAAHSHQLHHQSTLFHSIGHVTVQLAGVISTDLESTRGLVEHTSGCVGAPWRCGLSTIFCRPPVPLLCCPMALLPGHHKGSIFGLHTLLPWGCCLRTRWPWTESPETVSHFFL